VACATARGLQNVMRYGRTTGTGPVRHCGGSVNRTRPILYGQQGQTTTEYATTLLVVLLVTAALAAFVKSGGLTELFETVVEGLVDKVKG
jgi:hypothetical protein